jgi:6-phosphogluconolactonase
MSRRAGRRKDDDGVSRLFVGSYQSRRKPGVHCFDFDETTGRLRYLGGLSGIENPSYLAWDRDLSRLYVVQESVADPAIGIVAVEANGSLALRSMHATSGAEPCFVATAPWPQPALLVANYGGGSLDCFRVQSDGEITSLVQNVPHQGRGPHPIRQTAPHPHSVAWDPRAHAIWVPDLGLDAVVVYRRDDLTLQLRRVLTVPGRPGSGPRVLVFHPHAPYWYLANELDSTVAVYRYQLDPTLSATRQEVWSTLPEGVRDRENTVAHVALSWDLRRLYVSNRGYHSIAVFDVAPDGSHLERRAVVELAAHVPRHFALTPDGRWMIVAGQGADCLEVMHVEDDGVPIATGVTFPVERPSCVLVETDHARPGHH